MSDADTDISLDTNKIKNWRSIITLIVFVLTNLVVLFPFHIPIPVPRSCSNWILRRFHRWRVTSPQRTCTYTAAERPTGCACARKHPQASVQDAALPKPYVLIRFPMNFITAPLVADLFLLAIGAIGRTEVTDGTVGDDNIHPIDIMAFFITLAYIAISIDASGLIRWLAFKVLQKGGDTGRRLYLLLYAFFFSLASFIGNDPIVLSGTAFLAYMTRISENIQQPTAWIHAQFTMANVGSAILVSSNPTNLVLAGAFSIKFIDYTANMIVPVLVTVIVLFPFLLYIQFPDETLIPRSIQLHKLPEGFIDANKPVNPNIPAPATSTAVDMPADNLGSDKKEKILSLEEVLNPFLDKGGATFGAVIMAATLVIILVLNATDQKGNGTERPVYWITLPAAFVMFVWDVTYGWLHREETRRIAKYGRQLVFRNQELTENSDVLPPVEDDAAAGSDEKTPMELSTQSTPTNGQHTDKDISVPDPINSNKRLRTTSLNFSRAPTARIDSSFTGDDTLTMVHSPTSIHSASSNTKSPSPPSDNSVEKAIPRPTKGDDDHDVDDDDDTETHGPQTLTSLFRRSRRWLQETFPTTMAVLAHLPFPLIPFALAMFVLVQGLVTKGWVTVFAYGWSHWVHKTGTVGAIGGMGFLAVVLCNFAGTNIGTTILLCRVLQSWIEIHAVAHQPISQRTFWASVYSLALGVNYGAFSTAFSASLAGLLWRDILSRKNIIVKGREFARVNLPIIAVAMVVGSAVLIGEVYIVRSTEAYEPSG